LLFIQSLKELKAHEAGSIITLEVVYGIILAFIVLSEIPNIKTVLGGILIIGVTLYLTLEAKKTDLTHLE
jgi:drug/metabolite transporter (DMT)-like permease